MDEVTTAQNICSIFKRNASQEKKFQDSKYMELNSVLLDQTLDQSIQSPGAL